MIRRRVIVHRQMQGGCALRRDDSPPRAAALRRRMVSNRWDGIVEAVFVREDDAVEHPSAFSGAGPRPAVSIRRHVVVSGRDRSASEAVLGEASGLSGSISFVHGDVGLASDCERVVSETVTRYGA